ncbi:uncharacterized protein LOC142477032 [Ascaphus truei]|uniref:uncharacterized protein LOC142477032 n=1 Tax=Ascaphus truei TaxID=8439 RepID=UPI003F59FA91
MSLGNLPVIKTLMARSKRGHRVELTPDMISPPLGDFRHTMHVGRKGDVFGDTSFLSNYGGERRLNRGNYITRKLRQAGWMSSQQPSLRGNIGRPIASPPPISPIIKNAISLPQLSVPNWGHLRGRVREKAPNCDQETHKPYGLTSGFCTLPRLSRSEKMPEEPGSQGPEEDRSSGGLPETEDNSSGTGPQELRDDTSGAGLRESEDDTNGTGPQDTDEYSNDPDFQSPDVDCSGSRFQDPEVGSSVSGPQEPEDDTSCLVSQGPEEDSRGCGPQEPSCSLWRSDSMESFDLDFGPSLMSEILEGMSFSEAPHKMGALSGRGPYEHDPLSTNTNSSSLIEITDNNKWGATVSLSDSDGLVGSACLVPVGESGKWEVDRQGSSDITESKPRGGTWSSLGCFESKVKGLESERDGNRDSAEEEEDDEERAEEPVRFCNPSGATPNRSQLSLERKTYATFNSSAFSFSEDDDDEVKV